jgi:hypothetical protein
MVSMCPLPKRRQNEGRDSRASHNDNLVLLLSLPSDVQPLLRRPPTNLVPLSDSIRPQTLMGSEFSALIINDTARLGRNVCS